MKYFFLVLFSLISFLVIAQKKGFSVKNISLPAEISYYDNQFSGLYIYKEKLYLMSESRLQESAEAKLYCVEITDMQRKMTDTSYVLPFKRINILHLQKLREKMDASGDEYEGLEAIVIKDDLVYLTVETTTESANCYLIKGKLTDTSVILNEQDIIIQPKPFTPAGTHVYNAGYEALGLTKNLLFSFFEFNYFQEQNNVNMLTLQSFSGNSIAKFPIKKIPFRITDITATGKNNFTAINYFYKGEGKDEVYRVPLNETDNNALIKDSTGYRSYCRLVKIKYKKNRFSWKPMWDFPTEYMSYNWEGITAFKDGYFLINDKYTAAKPYSSVLLYISPIK